MSEYRLKHNHEGGEVVSVFTCMRDSLLVLFTYASRSTPRGECSNSSIGHPRIGRKKDADASIRSRHALKLTHRTLWIGEVVENTRHDGSVEMFVGERECVRVARDEASSIGKFTVDAIDKVEHYVLRPCVPDEPKMLGTVRADLQDPVVVRLRHPRLEESMQQAMAEG